MNLAGVKHWLKRLAPLGVGLGWVIFCISQTPTKWYVSQTGNVTGTNCTNGTCATNPFSLAELNTLTGAPGSAVGMWDDMADDYLCTVGDITSTMTIGNHGSTDRFTVEGSCDFTNQGRFLVTSGNAANVPAGRNNTWFANISMRATNGSAIRLQGGVTNFGLDHAQLNLNAVNGLAMECGSNQTYIGITMLDSQLNGNSQHGSACLVSGANSVTINGVTILRTQANSNGPTGAFSGFRWTADSGAASSLHFLGQWWVEGSQFNFNGHVGWRVVDFELIHNTAHLVMKGNEFIGNGAQPTTSQENSAGGGGALISGYGELSATILPWGTTEENANCVIEGNLFKDNDGPNSGTNIFATYKCLVRNNVCQHTTVAPHAPTGITPVDGNCYIFDQNNAGLTVTYNYAFDAEGNEATNSGACFMILGQDDITFRYNYGAHCKVGLWIGGIGNVTNAKIYNNTFADIRETGLFAEQSPGASAATWDVRNTIFIGRTGGTPPLTCIRNNLATDMTGANNVCFGFTSTYTSQAALTGMLTTSPLLNGQASGTWLTEDDFKISSVASPAYNSGNNFYAYANVDPAGVLVPVGTVDRGAFELDFEPAFQCRQPPP